MISVSFYLLTPEAKSQSQVYVSISNKLSRLRFATGHSFITSYCNIRKKKGTKELVKKNTVFYFEYISLLNKIRDNLIRFEMDLIKNGDICTLEQVRDMYYLQTGKLKDETLMGFDEAFTKFTSASKSSWSENTGKKFMATYNHLKEFEKQYGDISPDKLNEEFWNALRDKYFVGAKRFSNPSTNKYLKGVKQFLRYTKKKGVIKHDIDFEDLKYLDEVEVFKIALKEDEVETFLKHDLSKTPRLYKVRDLFALEILTGQRYSDLPKVLDKNNMSETSIRIYQQKTGELVTIPIHPKLKKHLAKIVNKYPDGLPSITNQKFNEYLKEIFKDIPGFDRQHAWITMTGKLKISHTDFRYNLITSHTGRRTFCTLALKSGIDSELIMKVTGHKTYDQFRDYVKVDDTDLEEAFAGMFNGEERMKARKAKDKAKTEY